LAVGLAAARRGRNEQEVAEQSLPQSAATDVKEGEAPVASISAEWRVEAAHHRLRVDRYVLGRLRDEERPVNAKRLRKAMREGKLTVNARVVVKPDFFVKRGDNVHVHIPPAVQSAVDALSIDWGSRILYEDADLLAVDKPSGVASAPAPGEMGTHAVALLEAFLRARDADAEGDPVCLANVHRLDKSTSGVLLLSKSPKAAAALGREFKARRVKKLYWAALYGRVDAPMGKLLETAEPGAVWQDMVVIKGGRAFVVDPTVDDAGATSGGNAGQPVPRKAALSVSVLQHIGRNVSIAEVQLTTGRLHQIRVQGASRGHFVLGDNIYGEPRVPGITRLCLHCSQMEVAHPSRPGEVVTVSAPVPDELLDVVDKQALNANLGPGRSA